MQAISVNGNLDEAAWTDLAEHAPLTEYQIERVGVLPNGTGRGRPAVMLLVRDLDGKPVVVQLTYGSWRMVTAAVNASPVMRETAQREGF